MRVEILLLCVSVNLLLFLLLLLLFALERHRQSQPAEFDEEIDVDFMRAIHLSLLQHSTPANHRSRESSSSSSSASSNRDQTQPRQDMAAAMTVFSTEDSASLQRAIELSLQDSAVGGSY